MFDLELRGHTLSHQICLFPCEAADVEHNNWPLPDQSTLQKQHYAGCLNFCEHTCSVEWVEMMFLCSMASELSVGAFLRTIITVVILLGDVFGDNWWVVQAEMEGCKV